MQDVLGYLFMISLILFIKHPLSPVEVFKPTIKISWGKHNITPLPDLSHVAFRHLIFDRSEHPKQILI